MQLTHPMKLIYHPVRQRTHLKLANTPVVPEASVTSVEDCTYLVP